MARHVKEGLWEVSPYNFDPGIRGQMELPAKVTIMDVTLREGRQVEGVSLGLEDVVEVARRLAEAGVPLIEMHHDEPEEMREVKKLGTGVKIMALVHPLAAVSVEKAMEAVDRVRSAGADIVCFAFALSNHHFATYKLAGLDISREKALELGCKAVQAAKKTGITVSCNLLDIARVDLAWLKTQAKSLADAGTDIIRVDDICAPCTPAVVKHLVREVKKVIPNTPIDIHTHNDFGLATALQLGALEGGAEILEGSVNGLGERSGIPNLAELVTIVELFYGYETGIPLVKLRSLSEFVADVFNQPLPPSLPIVGKRAFAHAIEGHHFFSDDQLWHTSITPKLVGHREYVPFCHYSGPWAVRHKCVELGLGDIPVDVARQVAEKVRRELRLRRHGLSDEVFTEILHSVPRR